MTKIYFDGPKKLIQEDRDPDTNKLITVITNDVLDNGQLLKVSSKIILNKICFNFYFN